MRILAIACAAGLLSTSAIAAPVFKTIDDPSDITFNQLLGINNSGVISGYFGNGGVGHPNKGYTISSPYKTFVSENFTGSAQTQVTGINDAGDTSGFFAPTDHANNNANFGFYRTKVGGKFTEVKDPLSSSTPSESQALGINNNNIVAGFYTDSAGNTHGYAYTISSAKFTPVHVAGGVSEAATGINNDNVVCGFSTNAKGTTLGFIEELASGTTAFFHVPGATTTQLLGVNKSSLAVGFYIGSDTYPHGVLVDMKTNKWIAINDSHGAMGTTLNGINDAGDIVGFYTDASNKTHGVLITGEKL